MCPFNVVMVEHTFKGTTYSITERMFDCRLARNNHKVIGLLLEGKCFDVLNGTFNDDGTASVFACLDANGVNFRGRNDLMNIDASIAERREDPRYLPQSRSELQSIEHYGGSNVEIHCQYIDSVPLFVHLAVISSVESRIRFDGRGILGAARLRLAGVAGWLDRVPGQSSLCQLINDWMGDGEALICNGTWPFDRSCMSTGLDRLSM